MFGRLVTIDGTEIFISCTPQTPYSEILLRAAAQIKREEGEATGLRGDRTSANANSLAR